jgi:hypothetical protein
MKAGYEPLRAKAQYADQMQEVVQPFMQTIQGLGIDAPRAVKALLEADHALRYSTPEQKLQLFNRLAQQYGVNLGHRVCHNKPCRSKQFMRFKTN